MVMTRAPLSRIEPDGRDRGTSTTTSVFCGSAASTAWRKNCAPHDQVTVRPSRVQAGYSPPSSDIRFTGTAVFSARPWMRTSTVSRPARGTSTR